MIKDNDHNSDLFSNNKKLFFFSNILYKKNITKSPVKYSHDSIFCCHSEITNQSQLHSTSDCMPLYCPNNWLAQFQSGRALKTWRERERLLNMEGPWMEEGEVGLFNE